MSAGPLTVYNGTTGVADTGGDSLTEDLNIYYSVRTNCSSPPLAHHVVKYAPFN